MDAGLFAVGTYAVLVLLWGTLVGIYLKHRRAALRDPIVATLLAVMTLDATKNLFESVFFGVLWGSRFGVLPAQWGAPLEDPWIMPLPKVLSVAVACVWLYRVAGRFIPDELREREARREAEAGAAREREATLSQVRESERQLQSLFSATTDLVSFWDVGKDGIFRLKGYNPASRLFFYVDDGVIGKSSLDLLGSRYTALLEEALRTAKPVHREAWKTTSAAQGERLVSMQLMPILDASGAVVQIASVGHDISDVTRRAEEQEERVRLESLGLLAGGVAHDFNNLLAVVKADVDLARAKDGGADDEVLAHAGDAIARARELVEQLMSTAGRRAHKSEPVDVAEVVADTVRLLSPAWPKVELRAQTRGGLYVVGDRAQLQQIVLNLLQNGAEAASSSLRDGKKPSVFAQVDLDGDRVVVVVEDSGPGVAADVRARIFDPFFTTKKRGRGLGLSTVFGLAQAHGGHVRVESEPGSGARFIVDLPRSLEVPKTRTPSPELSGPRPRASTTTPSVSQPMRAVPPTDPNASAPTSTPPASSLSTSNPPTAAVPHGPLRVLLVDDDDLVRKSSRRQLEHLGHQVLEASGGLAALDVDPQSYDVTVIDVTMPDLDGPATLERLRKTRPTLPAVIVTGRGDVALDDEIVLPKPFDPPSLQLALGRALLARVRSDAAPPR